MNDEFKNVDLETDFQRLDEQIGNQSRLKQIWTEREADAGLDEDEAKARMEQIRSKLSLQIREDPAKFKLDKITDKAVEAVVTVSPVFKEAQKAYFEAVRYKLAVKGVVSALYDRGESLTNMVKLHGQQWFADVKLDAKDQQVVNKQRASKPAGKVIKKKRRRKH